MRHHHSAQSTQPRMPYQHRHCPKQSQTVMMQPGRKTRCIGKEAEKSVMHTCKHATWMNSSHEHKPLTVPSVALPACVSKQVTFTLA